jgi:lipid A disaccharide synthetase
MATDENVLQLTADTSGTTAIAGAGTHEILTEIRDLLHATSETLERIVNNQDEIILLLGALLDVTAGDQPTSRTRSARTD